MCRVLTSTGPVGLELLVWRGARVEAREQQTESSACRPSFLPSFFCSLFFFFFCLQPGSSVASTKTPGEPCYPQNHVGRGWGIRDGATGAVRLPKILVLTIDDSVSAQNDHGTIPLARVLLETERPHAGDVCAVRRQRRSPGRAALGSFFFSFFAPPRRSLSLWALKDSERCQTRDLGVGVVLTQDPTHFRCCARCDRCPGAEALRGGDRAREGGAQLRMLNTGGGP